MNRFSKRLLLASAMLSGAMLSAQAHAQAASDVEEVIVTGSRIKRVDISGVGPATVVSQEEIANTGITNVETLLQRLPASAGAAGGQTSAYWTGNGYGTAQVNLRGLGIKKAFSEEIGSACFALHHALVSKVLDQLPMAAALDPADLALVSFRETLLLLLPLFRCSSSRNKSLGPVAE